jgi:hypothetical protein
MKKLVALSVLVLTVFGSISGPRSPQTSAQSGVPRDGTVRRISWGRSGPSELSAVAIAGRRRTRLRTRSTPLGLPDARQDRRLDRTGAMMSNQRIMSGAWARGSCFVIRIGRSSPGRRDCAGIEPQLHADVSRIRRQAASNERGHSNDRHDDDCAYRPHRSSPWADQVSISACKDVMGIPTSGPMLEFQYPGEKGNFTHHSAELRMRIDGLRYDG